jgi:hypothetical protein
MYANPTYFDILHVILRVMAIEMLQRKRLWISYTIILTNYTTVDDLLKVETFSIL